MEKLKNIFRTKNTKKGSYSIAVTAVVIAIIFVLNLFVRQLPENIRQIDISDTSIYEISSTTKKLVKNLDYDIKLYVLADKSETDDRIKNFISKYAGQSDKISVEWIDPVLHPSTLTKYSAEENSIVVSCAKTDRQTTVSFDDILVGSSSYYGTTSAATSFDGDGQLTSALNYVTSSKEYKAYYTTGHGETDLSTSVTDLMEKSRVSSEGLNLLSSTSIPDDCDLLIMNGPTSDLTDDEIKVLQNYMNNGGKIICLLAYTDKSMSHLYGFLKDYGMTVSDGYIADTERCYQGNYYYLIPNVTASGDMASGMTSNSVLLVNSKGLTVSDPDDDSITTESFMTTSKNGYDITEKGQTQGTYTLGATAEQTVSVKNKDGDEEDTESRLTVYGSNMLIDEQLTSSFSNLENLTLFMNSVTSSLDDADNISIASKSLEVTYNSIAYPGFFSILIIFVIPLALLAGGFIIWFRRRRR